MARPPRSDDVTAADWDTVRKAVGDSTEAGKGATTLFAGFICLAILDGLLILILGNQHDTPRSVAVLYLTPFLICKAVDTPPPF